MEHWGFLLCMFRRAEDALSAAFWLLLDFRIEPFAWCCSVHGSENTSKLYEVLTEDEPWKHTGETLKFCYLLYLTCIICFQLWWCICILFLANNIFKLPRDWWKVFGQSALTFISVECNFAPRQCSLLKRGRRAVLKAVWGYNSVGTELSS